jgi:probable F420-dependent oxidoreductase
MYTGPGRGGASRRDRDGGRDRPALIPERRRSWQDPVLRARRAARCRLRDERADTLKLALFGLHRGSSAHADTLARRARLAEEAGFESLWVGDHIALPGGGQGSAGNPPDQPRLEALATLSFLAAVTSRVRLAVGVIVLPQRQPVLLAKQVTTIDVLSRGRLILGVGVGYLEPELTAFGVSLAERGARTDEYLAAMRALWEEPTPTFAGRFASFSGVIERPRPLQRPHPPIVIGGHSPAAYRRAIEHGNGWYGWELDPGQTAQAIAELRATATRHARPAALGELEITITPPGGLDLETARRYADLGVARLAIQPHTMEGSAMDELIASVSESLVGRV